jgi:hypothetical protein
MLLLRLGLLISRKKTYKDIHGELKIKEEDLGEDAHSLSHRNFPVMENFSFRYLVSLVFDGVPRDGIVTQRV